MINLNTYIIEKLKINKESNLSKYNIGDHCLIFSFYNWESNNLQPNKNEVTIGIDVIKLRKITDEQIHYDYLTTFCHTDDNTAIMNIDGEIRKHSRYYCSNISNIIIEMIIPANESLGIIKGIEKKKSFNLFDKIGYCPAEFKSFENIDVPIKFRKHNKTTEITQQDINEIKNKLNNPAKITEKLHINKDSSISKIDPDIPLYEKYKRGDKCLYMVDSGLRSQACIKIDVIEITRVTKTILEYKFITTTSRLNYTSGGTIKFKDRKTDNYISSSNSSTTAICITADDSLNVIEQIRDNGNKIDIYKLLWKSGRISIDLLPVVELKDGETGIKRSDFKDITDKTLKLIENSL